MNDLFDFTFLTSPTLYLRHQLSMFLELAWMLYFIYIC